MKEELDQHFMKDKDAINLIVKSLNLSKSDNVLEIGAGNGALTKELIGKCNLTIIEKDKEMTNLKALNCKIVYGDGVRYLKKNKRFNKITGNIPYSISEPLFNVLLKTNFGLAVFTVGIKFAKKLTNVIDSKLSIIAPLFFNIKIIKTLPKSSFHPEPKTESAIILIKPKKRLKKHDKILKDFFLQTDKLAKNALRESLTKLGYTKRESRSIIEKNKLNLSKNTKNISLEDAKKIKEIIYSF
ncbi:hypothetical protein D6777_01545 [Candidatus Woesearchaeota archaeon]|nr:MAG: hypothetical protein D6777_01545 [Candidatus Woesearchaeota archaeon]